MPTLDFFQLDVFTNQAFGGNPLAVFPDAKDLSPKLMQQIAREMNLSETVFVMPSTDERALRRLRIFTPTTELPMAGHPVVGTWNLLARAEAGNIVVPRSNGETNVVRIWQEIGLGVLPVEIEFDDKGEPLRVTMTQGGFVADEITQSDELKTRAIEALGLQTDDLDFDLPIQAISTGLKFLCVPLRSLDALARCQINSTPISKFYRAHGATGCLAFTARDTRHGAPSLAHARMFAPDEHILEDPATGSACGALGGYLVKHKVVKSATTQNQNTMTTRQTPNTTLPQTSTDNHFVNSTINDSIVERFIIEQGDFMNRPSRIELEVTHNAQSGEIKQVRVGGASVVVARGELRF